MNIKDFRPVDNFKDIRCDKCLQLPDRKRRIFIKLRIYFQECPEETVWHSLNMSFCPGCLFDSADEVDIVNSLLSCDVIGTGCFGEYGRYDDFAEICRE